MLWTYLTVQGNRQFVGIRRLVCEELHTLHGKGEGSGLLEALHPLPWLQGDTVNM